MGFFLGASFILAGLVALFFLLRQKTKPFHVDVTPMEMKVMGINIFPLFVFMMSLMTDGMRKKMVTKQNAPKPGKDAPRDRFDCTGESPYKTEEIKPGKIWQVSYDMENMSLTNKAAKDEAKAFGMDPTSEKYKKNCMQGAAQYGEKAVELVKKDLEQAEFWYNKETITEEEVFKAAKNPLKMFVVKLNSGSLLLYTPVRIREEVGFGTWIDSLGPVEWIVVGSSYHTLNIKAVAERYPDAKIVGSSAAEEKLNFTNALIRKNFDYVCTKEAELKAANSILEKEGVKLFCVDGDVACNSVLAIAHNIAIECDLIYGHHDGEGMFSFSKETFREFKPENWGERLFKYALISKPNSPHGFLATYRYQMMDPNSLGAMSYEQPLPDGSTCVTMANSLRKLLKLDFEFGLGDHINCQSREDFRKNIDAAWNWLDGKPLI